MSADTHEKLIYMANQISKFFESKPHAEGVAGIAAPWRAGSWQSVFIALSQKGKMHRHPVHLPLTTAGSVRSACRKPRWRPRGAAATCPKTVYDPVDWKPRINPNSSVLALGGRETRPA